MDIHPESYAFELEADYRYVRRWVLTGELPKKLEWLTPLLRKNKDEICQWVKHNDAHWRQICKSEALNFRPMIKYVDFFEQHLRVERW